MGNPDWPEIETALSEKRHELKLDGVGDRIKKGGGIPDSLFSLVNLNFLEIIHSDCSILTSGVGKLTDLTNLVLHNNKLKTLPPEVGQLQKLKLLDVSYNDLESLPDTLFQNLKQLQSVNLSHNRLKELPSKFPNDGHLGHVQLSFNEFKEFPQVLLSQTSIMTLDLSNNAVETIPVEIEHLTSLKLLNVEKNSVKLVPGELGGCAKLKELFLGENPLQDKRLLKLVNEGERKMKALIEYVDKNCPKSAAGGDKKGTGGGDSKSSGKGKKKGAGASNINENSNDHPKDLIVVKRSDEENFRIRMDVDALSGIRPYFVGCIVRNLDLSDQKFKKFIQLQTKIHDDEKLCKKRVAATIATHDCDRIRLPLVFTAKAPSEIQIRPLNRTKDSTAEQLVTQLTQEAEALRKEKKRNVYSGVHQYLYLLEKWEKYPALVDGEGNVLSFPPISNSDLTKISPETRNVFVEITSSQDLNVCKRVMEAVLKGILDLELSANENSTGTENGSKRLELEQVRIFSLNDEIRVVFPSKVDLNFDEQNVVVEREN